MEVIDGEVSERQSADLITVVFAVLWWGVPALICWSLAIGFAVIAWDSRAGAAVILAIGFSWLFFCWLSPALFRPYVTLTADTVEAAVDARAWLSWLESRMMSVMGEFLFRSPVAFPYTSVRSIITTGAGGAYQIDLSEPAFFMVSGIRHELTRLHLRTSAEFRAELERRVEAARAREGAAPR